MLEPSVRGYILSNEITPMPASGVSADVKIELDCTRIVMRQPIRMAKYPMNIEIGNS